MSASPVELAVGGHNYRVVSSASVAELRMLADIVDARLRALRGGGAVASPNALLLVAMTLAHELEEERARRRRVEARARTLVRGVLERVDAALAATPEDLRGEEE